MKPDKLPETPQEWMQADAVKHVQKIKSVRQRQATYLAYIAGATTWAQWKVKHDELRTVLQEFVSKHEAGLLPDRFVYDKAIKILNDGK